MQLALEDDRRSKLAVLYQTFLETFASSLENIKEERGLDVLKDLVVDVQGFVVATEDLIEKHTVRGSESQQLVFQETLPLSSEHDDEANGIDDQQAIKDPN